MSTLFVDDINEKTSGNGVKIPGHVVQVVTATLNPTAQFATTSTSYVTDGDLPSATITPKFTDSKILIHYTTGMQHDGTGQIENTIYRSISGGAATDLSAGNVYGLSFKGTTNQSWTETSINWVDTPSTASAVTYTWYSRSENGASVSPMHAGSTWTALLMEIAQ